MNLCEFEIDMLRQLNGEAPASPGGAAVGVVLEFLSGSGLAVRIAGTWHITDKGREYLEKMK